MSIMDDRNDQHKVEFDLITSTQKLQNSCKLLLCEIIQIQITDKGPPKSRIFTLISYSRKNLHNYKEESGKNSSKKWVNHMKAMKATNDDLGTMIREIIKISPQSIQKIVEEKQEDEGPKSAIQYLLNLENTSIDRGFGPYIDECLDDLLHDCFAIADMCERLQSI